MKPEISFPGAQPLAGESVESVPNQIVVFGDPLVVKHGLSERFERLS